MLLNVSLYRSILIFYFQLGKITINLEQIRVSLMQLLILVLKVNQQCLTWEYYYKWLSEKTRQMSWSSYRTTIACTRKVKTSECL